MIEKFAADELDSWRTHPVTEAFRKEVEGKIKRFETDLHKASYDAPLDRIRCLSGGLHALDEVIAIIDTQGEEER